RATNEFIRSKIYVILIPKIQSPKLPHYSLLFFCLKKISLFRLWYDGDITREELGCCILCKCSEVVLLRSSQEILCVLLVDVSTSSEDRNLRLVCSHAINDIQDASVGLGLQGASRKQQFYSKSLKSWILKLRNLYVLWEGELYHHFFSSALFLLHMPFSDLTCIET
ncbi:hypothetical protein HID58_079065, partial [Brassica napus]